MSYCYMPLYITVEYSLYFIAYFIYVTLSPKYKSIYIIAYNFALLLKVPKSGGAVTRLMALQLNTL